MRHELEGASMVGSVAVTGSQSSGGGGCTPVKPVLFRSRPLLGNIGRREVRSMKRAWRTFAGGGA